MDQQVQEIIDRLRTEGVQHAEEQSNEIVRKAENQSANIIDNAKKQAEQLILDAKEEIKKMQESTHMALKQASRDTLLSLRKEIENTMQRIVNKEVGEALTLDNLATILEKVVEKNSSGKASSESIEVVLNPKDCEKLKSGFIAKLQKKVKQEINVQGSDDVGSGFTISYDSGKSSFEFTDESLAQYLSTYLNEQSASLVKEA